MPKTKVWQHAKKPDHSYTAGGNVIWYSQSGRIRLLLKKQHKTHYTCKYQIPNNFAIALLGIYHRETKTKFTQRLVQKKMFIAALIITPNRKQASCSSGGEWLNCVRFGTQHGIPLSNKMGWTTAIRKNLTQSPENYGSEKSQSQKVTYCVIPFLY